MEPFEAEEKGLFTFYREQADFQESIKRKKAQLNNLKAQNQKQKEKNLRISERYEPDLPPDKNQILKKVANHEPLKVDDIRQANSLQFQQASKIIEILEKHKYKKNSGREPKIIINSDIMIQSLSHNERNRLLAKMNDLKGRESMSDEEFQKYKLTKGDIFMEKKYYIQRANPFQKLALQPVCFQSSLELNSSLKVRQQLREQGPFKHIAIKNKHLAKSLQKNRQRFEIKQVFKLEESQIKKLPHIESKSKVSHQKQTSDILKKKMQEYLQYKFRPLKQNPLSKKELRQIKSQLRHKKQHSLNLDKLNFVNLDLQYNKSSFNNLNYHVFIQKKESKQFQENAKENKDKIYSNILKNMKFK